jgi:hypothetical protein
MGSDVAVSLHAGQGPAETAAAGVTHRHPPLGNIRSGPALACNNN